MAAQTPVTARADTDSWGAPLPRPDREALYAAVRMAPVFLAGATVCAFLPQVVSYGNTFAPAVARVLALVIAAVAMDSAYAALVYAQTRRLRLVLEAALEGRPQQVESRFRFPDEVLTCVGLAVHGLRQRVSVAEARATEQRRMSEASAVGVMELVTAMVEGEERIRAQIVGDLHDSVAQNLLVAIYRADDLAETLASLPAELGEAPSEADVDKALAGLDVDGLPEDLRTAEQSLRDVMKDARPPELSRGDLGTALTGLADDLGRRSGLRVTVRWPAENLSMPQAWATTVYRFCQEALRNVVKHAGVNEAEVRFFVDGSTIAVEVRDHGVGFAQVPQVPQDSTTGHHVGLELMSLRAHALGGRVQTSSTPGEGTTVTLLLPLPAAGRPDR